MGGRAAAHENRMLEKPRLVTLGLLSTMMLLLFVHRIVVLVLAAQSSF